MLAYLPENTRTPSVISLPIKNGGRMCHGPTRATAAAVKSAVVESGVSVYKKTKKAEDHLARPSLLPM